MAFFSYRLWYIDKIPFSGSSRNSKWYKTTSRPVQDVCLNNHMNNSSVGCLKYAQSRELLIFWMYISLSSPVALIPCVVLHKDNLYILLWKLTTFTNLENSSLHHEAHGIAISYNNLCGLDPVSGVLLATYSSFSTARMSSWHLHEIYITLRMNSNNSCDTKILIPALEMSVSSCIKLRMGLRVFLQRVNMESRVWLIRSS